VSRRARGGNSAHKLALRAKNDKERFMKRLLMACALASLGLACGDDDGDDKPIITVDGGIDAGGGPKPDSGVDSGGGGAVKVTNVGTACTTANASTTCTGTAAICQTTTLANTTIPGGSCSAACTASSECGTGGTCPTGEAIAMFGAQAEASLGKVGYCAKSCTLGGTTCGAGFSCVTLNLLSAQRGDPTLPLPVLEKPFCFPTPTAPGDGGVDGGARTADAGGIDSGR
jgi:hypothetical protein